jgi:transposase-like protein
MGRSTIGRVTLSETKKYRTGRVAQKLEIVLAGLRGDRSVAEVCREHEISENLFYTWREKLLEGGSERLAGKEERTELVELRRRVRDLERTLGRKTYELEILGNGFRTWE